jgi:hypothetical protein
MTMTMTESTTMPASRARPENFARIVKQKFLRDKKRAIGVCINAP